MKTKILIIITLALIIILSSCKGFDENNAKILIEARVYKCVSISKMNDESGLYYAAVDSSYKIRFFKVYRDGKIEEIK